MNILICGDSFAADWTSVSTEYLGWWNLLALKHKVTNLAQAGVGEYKILKQIKSVDVNTFDAVIVSHTSFSRVHTREHPLHKKGLHQDCDLIYTDISNRLSFFNFRSLKSAQDYFLYHYDDEYHRDTYSLIRKEIDNLIKIPYISISHIEELMDFVIEENHIDFSQLWKNNQGVVNHYNMKGNNKIFEAIFERLDNE